MGVDLMGIDLVCGGPSNADHIYYNVQCEVSVGC